MTKCAGNEELSFLFPCKFSKESAASGCLGTWVPRHLGTLVPFLLDLTKSGTFCHFPQHIGRRGSACSSATGDIFPSRGQTCSLMCLRYLSRKKPGRGRPTRCGFLELCPWKAVFSRKCGTVLKKVTDAPRNDFNLDRSEKQAGKVRVFFLSVFCLSPLSPLSPLFQHYKRSIIKIHNKEIKRSLQAPSRV